LKVIQLLILYQFLQGAVFEAGTTAQMHCYHPGRTGCFPGLYSVQGLTTCIKTCAMDVLSIGPLPGTSFADP